MNWKIRLKNPVFWVQIAADMTTWAGVWQIIKATAANPYCLFLIACNVWSAFNDPTTSGLTDSDRAKSYNAPLEK